MFSSFIEALYMVFWAPFPWATVGQWLLEPIHDLFQSIGL